MVREGRCVGGGSGLRKGQNEGGEGLCRGDDSGQNEKKGVEGGG